MKRWASEVMQFAQSTWMVSIISFDNDSRNSVSDWFHGIAANRPRAVSVRHIWAIFTTTFRDSSDLWLRASLFGPMLGADDCRGSMGVIANGSAIASGSKRISQGRARLSAVSRYFLDELFRLILVAHALTVDGKSATA